MDRKLACQWRDATKRCGNCIETEYVGRNPPWVLVVMSHLKLLHASASQAGVALITVLLVLALATVTVVSLSSERQLDIRHSENLLRNDQAWEYAHSLEQWAMQRLQNQAFDSKREISITEQGGAVLHAELDDLQGKLNLNNLIVEGHDSPEDVKRLQRL